MKRNVFTFFGLLFLSALPFVFVNAQDYSGLKPIQDFHRYNAAPPLYFPMPVLENDTLGWIRFRGKVPSGYYTGSNIMSWVTGPVVGNTFPANMVFRTNDIMRMTIRDNGNVGVNTFLPEQLFTVSHPTLPVVRFDRSGAGERDFELFNGANGDFFFRGGSDNTGPALTNFMVITHQGRVGIGRDDPQQLLTLSNTANPVFRFDRSGDDMELSLDAEGLFFRGGADAIGPALTNFMVLTHQGRVGIGRDDPQQLLTLSNTANPVFRFDRSGDDMELSLDAEGLFFRGGADATGAGLTNLAVITHEGRLGVGLDEPQQLLTISNPANPVFRFDRSTGGEFDMEFSLEDEGDLIFRGGADDNGAGLLEFMRLKGDGKLAIGTTNTPDMLGSSDLTDYTVFAAGGILTEEVRVRTGWADYVFEKNYFLQSLEEVDCYIEENGRLPEMPSTQEVVDNGLELGDIAVRQQVKIEEIYLHLIEMDKQLKALKQENEALKARIEQLER